MVALNAVGCGGNKQESANQKQNTTNISEPMQDKLEPLNLKPGDEGKAINLIEAPSTGDSEQIDANKVPEK